MEKSTNTLLLDAFLNTKAIQLAGARALIQQPKILLLDEPFSALDHQMRSKLQTYLLEIHKEFNLTLFLISHDVGEIIRLSHKIAR